MDEAILDTDTLTEIFKRRNALVQKHAQDYLKLHGQFAISEITRYEVVRGLRYKGARAKLEAFGKLCQGVLRFTVTSEVLDRAAHIWAEGRKGGHSHRDADLIIAATALVHGRTLVTGNTGHFRWISGLRTVDWRDA